MQQNGPNSTKIVEKFDWNFRTLPIIGCGFNRQKRLEFLEDFRPSKSRKFREIRPNFESLTGTHGLNFSTILVAKLCCILFCGSPTTNCWEPLLKMLGYSRINLSSTRVFECWVVWNHYLWERAMATLSWKDRKVHFCLWSNSWNTRIDKRIKKWNKIRNCTYTFVK